MNTPSPKPTEIAKPCPFCGTTEIEGPFPINRAAEWFVLRCGNPGCQAEIEAREAHEALTLWNRRPAPETQAPVESAPALAPFEKQKYDELLYAVVRKFPNESRHETALRYIREAEKAVTEPGREVSAVVEEVRGK